MRFSRREKSRCSASSPGGNRNRDIAERLFISEETLKVHM
ncbi:MAG: LuxR C-terminal-related transcriptional regulator [Candidatus Acidiferrales bacterium]